jgi:peptidoglycan hydrolase-like protein with peptidoglycan-binding domain
MVGALLAAAFFASPVHAQSADTLAQIQALLQQIQALQALLSQAQSSGAVSSVPATVSSVSPNAPQVSCITLGRPLSRGASGADVQQLQQFLGSSGYFSDVPTGYFGALTEAAVQSFQRARGIVSSGTPDTNGYGAVGPRTMAAIHDLSCNVQATVPVSVPIVTPVVPTTPVPVTPVQPVVPVTPVTVVPPTNTCQINGLTFAEGATRTMYTVDSVAAGGDCVPYHTVRTCLNGSFTGNPAAIYLSCSVRQAPATCTVGSTVMSSGQSQVFYSALYAAAGTSCSSLAQTRTCTNGTIDGSSAYTYSSCSASSAATGSCTWAGITLQDTATTTFYSTSRPPLGSACSAYAQVKKCTNGLLDGSASYSFASCNDGISCTQDGATVAEHATTTFYYQRVVPAGESCSSYSLSRTCSNGVLSGNTAYRYSTCSAVSSGSCTLNDSTVANGSSQLFYSVSAAPSGSLCSSLSQTRTCSNGTLSGDAAYQYGSCSDTTGCILDGAPVQSGAARVFYSATSVAYGTLCSSIGATRTCTNGVLSGDATYNHATCTVAPPTAMAPGTLYLASAYDALKAALLEISRIIGR